MSAKQTMSKKPYCKVCHDAGKSETMYTSHTVKKYNVNIGQFETTCPTLMGLECRYCFKTGHTVKFCTILEQNKKIDTQRKKDMSRLPLIPVKKEEETKKKFNSKFASLEEDSSDDEEEVKVVVKVVDDFPTLGGGKSSRSNEMKSYSCVAATPVDTIRLELLNKIQKEKMAPVIFKTKAVKWVDEEQSEDEDDDEEYVASKVETRVEYEDNDW